MSNFKGYPNEYALVEFALNKHSSRHIVVIIYHLSREQGSQKIEILLGIIKGS